MAEKGWGDLIREHSPHMDEQNKADLEFLNRGSALSAREKLLIAMVLDAAANKPAGARSYCCTSSTRLFLARPSSVWLVATGL